MNLMFIIDGVLLTPPAGETVLAGVTRDSLLSIARDMGWPVEERPISLKELEEAFSTGKKVEAFGAGTAAVVAPLELIQIDGQDFRPYIAEDAQMYQLKARLSAIRAGKEKDPYAWNTVLEKALTK